MSNSDDAVARWRAAALEQEGAAVAARGRAALERAPDEQALRDLALAGGLVELAAATRAAAVALVRWGLEAERPEAARWDAVHAAAELGLAELTPELERLLAGGASSPVRGRAAEAYAALVPAQQARTRLEPLRQNDPDWAVRRLVAEALRQVEARRAPERGDPFARFKALVRGGRLRVEGGSAPLTAQQVAALGLRLPASYRLFLASACAGGRLVLTEFDPKGALRDAASLTLTPPAALRAELEAGGPRPDELRRIQEYVWARYVEGEKGGPSLDEDHALRLLGARYDRGLVDADAWNYGVLLFEAAYRDEARRARHLVRAVAVLEAYRELEREPWDVVDDRLEEARGVVEDERLRERLAATLAVDATDAADADVDVDALLTLGRREGVDPIAVDLERPGVLQLDPDDPKRRVVRVVAATLLELLGDPWCVEAPAVAPRAPRAAAPVPAAAPTSAGPTPAAGGAAEPGGPFGPVLEHLAAGRHRQAGRALADTLEGGADAATLEAAAALLCRPELTPLLAAQLLACVPMVGDKKTVETAREVLQALPGARVKDMLDAVAPYDEDGSQVALLVDAAAGLRKKSHAEAKDAAKRMKTSRSKAHVRTAKNPFYK